MRKSTWNYITAASKMRRLTKKKALTLVRELDAFPKVPESYVESTASGGTGTDATASCSPQFHILLSEGATVILTHFDALSSVSDSIHSHGCPCLPGILCVQRHMDEVWVWGGQRLQQVRAKDFTVLWHYIVQTTNQLIKTVICRFVSNENNC